ncbi:MAG: hypothetical protein P4M04_12695 [Acidobacteriota bacterium]|nr:hypothetical protein [Acidobacteriota bacterium]
MKEPIAAPGDPGEAKSLSPIATLRAAYERSTYGSELRQNRSSLHRSVPARPRQATVRGLVVARRHQQGCPIAAWPARTIKDVLATQFNRFLAFDEESNVVRVEPGVGSTTSWRNIIATIKDMLACYQTVFSPDYNLPSVRERPQRESNARTSA